MNKKLQVIRPRASIPFSPNRKVGHAHEKAHYMHPSEVGAVVVGILLLATYAAGFVWLKEIFSFLQTM